MLNVRRWMFGVCFSPCFRHISPPNEPADQRLPGALRASRRPDDSCHPDAATKERRPRRSVWRRRHGEHFRRANHECAGEVHHVAGRNIFRAYVRTIGPLCAPQRSQQRLPSRTDEKPARANLTCACETTIITGLVTGNYAGTGFARCFSSRKRRTNGFAKIIARKVISGPVATALRAVSRFKKQAQNRPDPDGYSAIYCEKPISLCARILAGTAREVFLSQSRDRCRSARHLLWTS